MGQIEGQPNLSSNRHTTGNEDGVFATNISFAHARIVVHGISFGHELSALSRESMRTLDMIAKMLIATPELKYEVGGHYDSDGEADDLVISAQHAQLVRRYLLSTGVAGSQLQARGYGHSRPIDYTEPEGNANKGRIEFIRV